ncbi:GTPase HflX, partial [Halorubrum sp. SS5]
MSGGAGEPGSDGELGSDGEPITGMRRAVVTKRVDSGEADLSEIRQLAAAAGYEVVDELT